MLYAKSLSSRSALTEFRQNAQVSTEAQTILTPFQVYEKKKKKKAQLNLNKSR